MTADQAAPNAEHCFVCGTENPIGLRIKFELNEGVCRGAFTPNDNHAGFDGITHGGIIYAVLDDAMANWLFLQGVHAYTAKAEVRYRTPLDVGTPIAVECRLKRHKQRLVVLEAMALRASDDIVVAQAEASFMLDDSSALQEH